MRVTCNYLYINLYWRENVYSSIKLIKMEYFVSSKQGVVIYNV